MVVIQIRPRRKARAPYIRKEKLPEVHPEVAAEMCREFSYWLSNSAPVEKYCYCVGPCAAGHPVARMAYKAYERGQVTLFQRREGKKFSYWAQKKKEKR